MTYFGYQLKTDYIMEKKIIEVSGRKYILNKDLSDQALSGKRVLNGDDSLYFNILPLKYGWSYDMYCNMKANHWEPEDISMAQDISHWKDTSGFITDSDRWVIRLAIGYFSAAEGLVGDNILNVVRRLVTAPELKMVLGRHAHEENIHADSLLYIISSLGIDPHECDMLLKGIPSIKDKASFIVKHSHDLRDAPSIESLTDHRRFSKNLFLYGQCMEGTQFYGLFGMILSLCRQNKFPGIGQMFKYTLRDESNHIELLRRLFLEHIAENEEVWDIYFQEELYELMVESIRLEKDFINDCIPKDCCGLIKSEFKEYIDYIGIRRLVNCGLRPHTDLKVNPPSWLCEMMDAKKEQNFFEGRVTEYQKSSVLSSTEDDDL